MKRLFLLKSDPDLTIQKIIEESEKESEVIVIDLREKQNYAALVETIEICDRVITW